MAVAIEKNDKRIEQSTAPVAREANWVLLAASVTVVAALAVGAYFLREYQVDRTALVLKERALELEAEGDGQKAAGYLFRYTRFRPQDTEARVKLAQIYDSTTTTFEGKLRAIELYYAAVGVASDANAELEMRRRLADLLLETGRLPLAKSQAMVVLKGDHDREVPGDLRDPAGNRILAEVLYRQYVLGVIRADKVDGETIGDIVERALNLNPHNARLAIILASIYRSQSELLSAELSEAERHSRADRIMQQLIANDPQNPLLRLANFQYRHRYSLPDAEAELDKALELGPEVLGVRLAAAEYQRSRGEDIVRTRRRLDLKQKATDDATDGPDAEALFARAREHLEYILNKIDPRSEAAYVALGDVYSTQGKVDDAKVAWNQGLERIGETSLALNMRMTEALAREDAPATKEHLDRLDTALSSLHPSVTPEVKASLTRTRDLIDALWLLRREKPAQAIPLLTPIVAQGRQGLGTRMDDSLKAAMLLGEAYESLDQWEDAARVYELATSLAPDDWRFRLGAAKMWEEAGHPERALRHLERVADQIDTPGIWMAVAQAQYSAMRRRPAQQRNWQPFQEALKKTKVAMEGKQIERAWLVDLLEANYELISAKDLRVGRAKASVTLNRLEEEYPDDKLLWATLVSAYQRIDDPEQADRCLTRLRELDPDSHLPYLKQAELLVQRDQRDAAQQVLVEAMKTLSPAESLPLKRALVQLHVAKGEVKNAQTQLEQLHDDDPDDPRPLYLLIELALRSGDLPAAARWETELRQTEGHISTLSRYYRVWRLTALAKDKNDPALSQADREQQILLRHRPNWPLTHFAQAMLYEKRGELHKAGEALEMAIHLGDERLTTYQRLVAIYYLQRRFGEAERLLKGLETRIPNSPRLHSLAISVAAQLDDVDGAAKFAQQGVQQRPNDPLAWLWFAHVKLVQSENEEALKAFRKANQLAPNDARTWNGLFTYYFRTGQPDEARQTLEQLIAKVELPPAEEAFIFAQGLELLNDRKAAGEQYILAAQGAEDRFPIQMRVAQFFLREDAARAEAALRTALRIQPESGAARRMLAALLTDRGDAASWSEARELLAQNSGPLDDRVLGVLHAMRQSDDRVADLEASRRLLEGLVLRSTNASDIDRLLLALVYAELSKVQLDGADRQRFVSSARRQFRALVVGHRPAASHLAVFIRFLLEQNDTEEARQWLKKLEELNPDAIVTISLRARWLQLADRADEIQPHVEAAALRLHQKLKTDEEKLNLTAAVGQIYAQVDDAESARRWFKKLADASSDRFAPLALALARKGQTQEAVQLCLAAAADDETPRTALVLANVLLSDPSYDAPATAEQVLEKAIAKHPDEMALLMSVANLRVTQEDSTKAITLYEKIERHRPRDPIVLNNLATLLAEQKGREKKALEYIERAIAIAGPRAALLDTQGTILLRLQQPKEAAKILETAASDPNADPRYRFHYAVALAEIQADERAKAELRAAIDDELERQILTPEDQQQLAALRRKYGML